MTEFLTYDRTKEVVVVNPLFTSLRESMQLKPKSLVDSEESHSLTLKQFYSKYLIKNNPVKVLGLASEWNATKKWNFDYFLETESEATLLFSSLSKPPGN